MTYSGLKMVFLSSYEEAIAFLDNITIQIMEQEYF